MDKKLMKKNIDKIKQEYNDRFGFLKNLVERHAIAGSKKWNWGEIMEKWIEQKLQEAYEAGKKEVEKEQLINKLVSEVMENKARIIDDFFKAYIASRIDEKDFIKKIPKLTLIEKRIDSPTGFTTKYWIEVKRGRTRKDI